MSYAVLFPGQGSQFVGMGRELFAARSDLLGVGADEVLGWSLAETCLEGPEELLTRTDRAQPALYALAYALWAELQPHLPRPIAAAGHSLGEYTAYAAADTFGFFEGLLLVAARGRAMAEAASLRPSGMAALLGTDVETAESITAERAAAGGLLWVANLNGPGQVVVAGAEEDLEWLVESASTYGIRRVVRLNVAGAFHSPLMEPAVEAIRQALEMVGLRRPRFDVWSNALARPVSVPELRGSLATQVTAPVRFGDSLSGMSRAGVDVFVHIGPGDVTAGMARRAVPGASIITVSDLASVPAAVARLT